MLMGDSQRCHSLEVRKSIITAPILSRIDYVNAMLAGLPSCRLEQLQRVINMAAKLIFNKGSTIMCRRSSTSFTGCIFTSASITRSPRWYLKISWAAHRPTCHSPIARQGRRGLRSTSKGSLFCPHANRGRSIDVVGPRTWNRLDPAVTTSDPAGFQSALRTFLFRESHPHPPEWP